MAATLSLSQASFALGPDSASSSLGTPSDQIDVKRVGRDGFSVSNQKPGSPIENLTLDTGDSSTFVRFRSEVLDLDASFGLGFDTLVLNKSAIDSTIKMGAGADSFSSRGDFFNSTVNTGAGSDTLIFSGDVSDSTIVTGAGNDTIVVRAGSEVTNSSFYTGEGNDILTFQGTVFGNDPNNSLISMGDGSDTLVFGARSFVEGYTIDLGSDSSVDRVFFNGGIGSDVTITGAGTLDTLFIGAGEFAGTYTYDETESAFTNSDDTLTWLT